MRFHYEGACLVVWVLWEASELVGAHGQGEKYAEYTQQIHCTQDNKIAPYFGTDLMGRC